MPQSFEGGFIQLNATYHQADRCYRSMGARADSWANDADLDASYGSWTLADGRPTIVLLVTQADNIGSTYALTARLRVGSVNYDFPLRTQAAGAMRTGIYIADFDTYTGPPNLPATGTAAARVLFTTGGSDVPDTDRTIGLGLGGKTDI